MTDGCTGQVESEVRAAYVYLIISRQSHSFNGMLGLSSLSMHTTLTNCSLRYAIYPNFRVMLRCNLSGSGRTCPGTIDGGVTHWPGIPRGIRPLRCAKERASAGACGKAPIRPWKCGVEGVREALVGRHPCRSRWRRAIFHQSHPDCDADTRLTMSK